MGPQQTKKNGDFGDAAPKQNKKMLRDATHPSLPLSGTSYGRKPWQNNIIHYVELYCNLF